MLDIKQAERLARECVGTSAVLALYNARPKGIYWLEGAEEHLFAVHRQGRHYVGGDEIVAVNKATGVVRSAGHSGE